MTQEKLTITGPGHELASVLHLPQTPPPWRPAVITHGLFSSKSSEKHVRAAEALARTGLAAIRFDCLGCGQTGGRIEATTLSGRVTEAEAVLSHLQADPRIEGDPVLMGSSFGGSTSLLLAARRGGAGTGAVVAWSAPCDYAALADHRDELEYEMDQEFFDDLAGLDIISEVRGLSPCLIVHGENDETVPLAQAHTLADALGPPVRLVVVRGADHALTNPGAIDLALGETLKFLAGLSLDSPGPGKRDQQ